MIQVLVSSNRNVMELCHESKIVIRTSYMITKELEYRCKLAEGLSARSARAVSDDLATEPDRQRAMRSNRSTKNYKRMHFATAYVEYGRQASGQISERRGNTEP